MLPVARKIRAAFVFVRIDQNVSICFCCSGDGLRARVRKVNWKNHQSARARDFAQQLIASVLKRSIQTRPARLPGA